MDFSAWFEVCLGGRWYTFDARHNTPRIGRILMATGRDATDVALSTSFGAVRRSSGFTVVTDEVPHAAPHTTVSPTATTACTIQSRRTCPRPRAWRSSPKRCVPAPDADLR